MVGDGVWLAVVVGEVHAMFLLQSNFRAFFVRGCDGGDGNEGRGEGDGAMCEVRSPLASYPDGIVDRS